MASGLLYYLREGGIPRRQFVLYFPPLPRCRCQRPGSLYSGHAHRLRDTCPSMQCLSLSRMMPKHKISQKYNHTDTYPCPTTLAGALDLGSTRSQAAHDSHQRPEKSVQISGSSTPFLTSVDVSRICLGTQLVIRSGGNPPRSCTVNTSCGGRSVLGRSSHNTVSRFSLESS